MVEIQISNKKINSQNPTYIIAELSANHNQNFDLAVKTIEAAAKTGVDAIKLQTYTPDTITMNSDLPHFMTREDSIWAGQRLYDLYKKAYTPWEWHPKLKQIANQLGLHFFSSPFDHSAVDFLQNMDVPAYKIASLEITDIPLIEYTASKGKPIILSTGIANEEDIQLALDACYRQSNRQIAILKCTSAYPTPLEDSNLNTIPLIAEKYKTVVGISDHTLGTLVPTIAVSLGARIIEKHIILDKSLGGVDSAFSLDPNEFKVLVDNVRDTEKALGQATLEPSEKMISARRSSRSLFAIKNIQPGEKITHKNVRSLRPGLGLHPKYLSQILGKKAKNTIDRGTPLSFDFFE